MKSRGGKCLALLVLLLTFTLGAKANPVDSRRAHLVASNFLNAYGARSAELTDISARAGFTNLYVFSTENSFVLLAADDRVQPILGYSFTDKFDLDNMPDNKRAWIQGYSDEIQAAIDCRSVATAEVAQQWRDLADNTPNRLSRAVVVPPLVQTQWNQGSPYNDLCPSGTVTGCVATAMAQVMKYYNHPSHGIGSHSYTWNGQTLSADFQNTNYNWANMINSYAYGAGTTAQKQAVATLMYHCGVSVEMTYGPSSGAPSISVVGALINYFHYASDINYQERSSYGDDAWIAMLKTELDAHRPIFYSGRYISGETNGGHAFICDGYRDDNYFHFNWGWGGYQDEYYVINMLNPGSGGAGSGSGTYNLDQSAIFNIRPSQCTAAAPLNLTRTVSGRNVSLNWNTASNAVSYNIYCNGNLVGNATTNSYVHTNAPFGESSYYVRSVDSNGELSLSSNAVTVTIDYPTPVVTDLAATLSGRNVSLTWTAPEWCYPTTPTATLSYGGTRNAIMGVGIPMYWGHRYLAANLNDYNNMKVYKVSFYAEGTGEYRVHVYQGTTSNNRPQTEVLQQTFTAGNTGWFDIDLTNTVDIDATQDLWVFIFDPLNREHPASFCTNNIDPEGGYISVEGYGGPTGFVQAYTDRNFNIRTYISDGNYTYNLYRNGSGIANNLTATTYTDNNLADGTYNYTVKTNYYGGLTEASNTATVTIATTMHEITATANPTAGGTVSGGGTYNHGASCTLTATANTGYNFVNWTKNGTQVSTNASFSFNVTEDATYVANFEAITYTITATANPTAGGTVSGGGTYNHGASCTLTATANTGYNFVNWTKNGTQVSTNASFSFNVTENATYVAHFEVQAPTTYTITATANPTAGGTVSGGGTYNQGASCTLTATANSGYNFVNWTKNGTQVSTNASFSFNVTENATYVAHFEEQVVTYTITATANPSEGGTVTGGGTYNQGASCTLTATANMGYTFVNWTKGGIEVSTNASFSFTVTENAAYVANFEPIQWPSYTITATANPTEGGTVTGTGTYDHGQICTLIATANPGYTFVNWTENGAEVSTFATYSFPVSGNRNFVANFVASGPQVFEITAKTEPEGNAGLIEGIGFYNYGETCTLTVTPYGNYQFVNWTLNGVVVAETESFSFVVTEDQFYIANLQYITDVEELPSVTTEVYPNPAINKITVEISEPVETLEIYSSTGALVYRVAAGFDKTTIDVSGLAPGTYTLRVNTTQGVVSKKFVKNR